jgi:hypothetical protein
MDTPGKQHVPHWIVYNRDSQTNKHLVVFIARIGQGRSISHIGCVIQYGNTQLKADMMTIHIFVVCKKNRVFMLSAQRPQLGPQQLLRPQRCVPAAASLQEEA